MFKFKKAALAAVVAVGLFSPAAFAESSPKYELRRQGMGPRPDRYVWVRVDRDTRGDRPYALTGDADRPAKRRVVQRWAGPHYIGPVTVLEKDTQAAR